MREFILLVLILFILLIALVPSEKDDVPQDEKIYMPPALAEFLAVTHGQADCEVEWEGQSTRGRGIPRYFYAVQCGLDNFRFAECHYYDNSLHCYPLRTVIR